MLTMHGAQGSLCSSELGPCKFTASHCAEENMQACMRVLGSSMGTDAAVS